MIGAARAAAYAAALLLSTPVLFHLWSGSGLHVALLADDFYYYALTARWFAVHGWPSFDGATLTNGFHPLFFLLVAALARLGGGLGPAFFALLPLVFVAACCAAFELYLRFGKRLAPGSRFVPVLALLASLETTRMIVRGMETTLALPLHLFVLERVAASDRLGPRRAAGLGFACSLLVLARLDELLFAGLLVIGALAFARASWREKLVSLAAFGAAGLLVPLYLAVNLAFFDGLLPVSGEAKQLTDGLAWNGHLLRDLAGNTIGAAALVLVPLGIALAFVRTRGPARFAALLALVFPIAFYAVYALRSDWWLFYWYLYPLPAALFVAGLLAADALDARLPRFLHVRAPAFALAAAALLVVAAAGSAAYSRTFGFSRHGDSIYDVALRLRDELRERPGRYAMGDRAGMTAYLLEQPVLQLEGLVADRALVDAIRRETPLEEVLRRYGVDYLIVSVYRPLERDGDCALVAIPDRAQAGPRSKKMAGRFCSPPLLAFETPLGANAAVCYTYVFAVK